MDRLNIFAEMRKAPSLPKRSFVVNFPDSLNEVVVESHLSQDDTFFPLDEHGYALRDESVSTSYRK